MLKIARTGLLAATIASAVLSGMGIALSQQLPPMAEEDAARVTFAHAANSVKRGAANA
jgi:hypothetical protein